MILKFKSFYQCKRYLLCMIMLLYVVYIWYICLNNIIDFVLRLNQKKGRFDLPLSVPLYDQKPCLEWFQYVHHLMNSKQSFLLF